VNNLVSILNKNFGEEFFFIFCCVIEMAPKEIDPDNRCGFRLLMTLAGAMGILSICVLIYGFEVFLFEGFYKYGGWWSGLCGLMSSLFFLLRAQHVPVHHLYIAAFLALVLSFAACIVDAVGYNFLITLKACTNNSLPPVNSGNSVYFLASETCQVEYNCDCACVSASITANPTCYLFTAAGIAGESTCNPILTTYPALVYDAMVFEACTVVTTALLMLTLSQITREMDEEETFGRQAHSVQLANRK
jgi:hypothetical protein